jgi:hypothetical protein
MAMVICRMLASFRFLKPREGTLRGTLSSAVALKPDSVSVLEILVGAAGLEPATPCLEGRCSIRAELRAHAIWERLTKTSLPHAHPAPFKTGSVACATHSASARADRHAPSFHSAT